MAVVLLSLVAVPSLLSEYQPSREPGVVDIGIPGIVVVADPPAVAEWRQPAPPHDAADHVRHALGAAPSHKTSIGPNGHPAM